MRPRQITALLTLGVAVILALCLGISIATENYALLIFGATIVVVGILVLMPGYVPLFVFGVLMPFSLPVPFIYSFPFLLIALGICGAKYWLRSGLKNRKLSQQFSHYRAMNISIALFFSWSFVRFCMKPALPNLMGWGTNITGFRAWLTYGLSGGVMLLAARFMGGRAGLVKLMQWMGYVSIFFVLVFVPITLSRSPELATLLTGLGMYVAAFDNGMLRFVVLPGFGIILLSLLLLPNLLRLSRSVWCVVFLIAMSAIVLGGSRSGLGMAFVVVTVIPVLRGKVVQSVTTIGSMILISAAAYFAGPILSQIPNTGFLRALALVSPDLTESTGGDVSMEWREVRWQRGLEEIRKHPIVGVGYGGLENAFTSDFQTETESEDISLATGGIHNGYIAGALAMGIPAALLFVYILIAQIFSNARRALALHNTDPTLAEVHCFVTANLLAMASGIFFGADINDPYIWFLLTLGLFVRQLRINVVPQAKVPLDIVQPALARQFA